MMQVYSSPNIADVKERCAVLQEKGIETSIVQRRKINGKPSAGYTWPELWIKNNVDGQRAKILISKYENNLLKPKDENHETPLWEPKPRFDVNDGWAQQTQRLPTTNSTPSNIPVTKGIDDTEDAPAIDASIDAVGTPSQATHLDDEFIVDTPATNIAVMDMPVDDGSVVEQLSINSFSSESQNSENTDFNDPYIDVNETFLADQDSDDYDKAITQLDNDTNFDIVEDLTTVSDEDALTKISNTGVEGVFVDNDVLDDEATIGDISLFIDEVNLDDLHIQELSIIGTDIVADENIQVADHPDNIAEADHPDAIDTNITELTQKLLQINSLNKKLKLNNSDLKLQQEALNRLQLENIKIDSSQLELFLSDMFDEQEADMDFDTLLAHIDAEEQESEHGRAKDADSSLDNNQHDLSVTQNSSKQVTQGAIINNLNQSVNNNDQQKFNSLRPVSSVDIIHYGIKANTPFVSPNSNSKNNKQSEDDILQENEKSDNWVALNESF